MDCLTFRRLKLAAPQAVSAAQLLHLRSCPACGAFARQLDAFERDLCDVVTLPVPDGLAEQIILGLRRPQRFGRSHLAMAATVMLTLIASFAFVLAPDRNSERDHVVDALAAHVASEPEILRDRGSIEPAKLVAAFSQYGGILEESVGVVRHVDRCVILGVMAHHIVIQTDYGPATLILLPKTRTSTKRPLLRDGFAIAVMPLQSGSLGILTDTADRASKVESLIQSRVRWQS